MGSSTNLAFYRKYRPKTFEDIVGQQYIVETLKNGVVGGTPSHAYLFTGSRGTGKTSAAKILAKALNCPNQTGGNPCLTCEVCLGVDDGSVMDVMEIDAASNNGVDNIRELREQAQFLPAVGHYRIYIIDEVHMLSIGAFNALLKIMEEPPQHVIFILATTEVHKIPATIISRCQRFDFRRVSADTIATLLLKIAGQEGIDLQEDAALLIATLGDGGLRDSISILDKSSSVSKMLDYETVAKIVGIAGSDHLFQISEHIKNRDTEALLLLLNELSQNSLEPERLIEQLIEHYRSILIALTVKQPENILNVTPDDLVKLANTAKNYSVSQILYIQNCLQQSLNKMQKTVNKKAELELLLIKICTPQLDSSVESLLLRIEQLEAALKAGKFDMAAAAAKPPEKAPPKATKQPEEPLPKSDDRDGKEHVFTVPKFVTEGNTSEPPKAVDEPPWETAEENPPIAQGQAVEPSEINPITAVELNLEPLPEPIYHVEEPKAEVAPHKTNTSPKPEQTESFDDGDEDDDMAPFIAWDSTLEILRGTNGALYGALMGSKAYVNKKHVLIDCKDTLFLVMMRENEYAKESLKNCIFEVTGQKYSIGPYKAKNKPEVVAKEDPLQKFVASLASLPDDIVEIN